MSLLRRTAPVLLHPVTLGALALWALNDHVLKGWGPAVLTGKLSDVTALVVCPTVLLGILEWCNPEWVERHLDAALAASCGAIGLLLVGLQLSPAVELAYQHVLGSAQYVARSAGAAITGARAPAYLLVQTTPDVTDLLTLPALAVPGWLLLRSGGRASTSTRASARGRAVLAGCASCPRARRRTDGR